MTPVKNDDPIINGSICPYCIQETQYVDSSIIYGRSYGMIYWCQPCNAYVGVHKGTDISLGRLANATLRELKKQAHFHFDQIWKNGIMTRNEAYSWLSNQLSTPIELTHIGMFDENKCGLTIHFAKQFLHGQRIADKTC